MRVERKQARKSRARAGNDGKTLSCEPHLLELLERPEWEHHLPLPIRELQQHQLVLIVPPLPVILRPRAHVRLFSRQRTLSVRTLTDVNVGSDLRGLLRGH